MIPQLDKNFENDLDYSNWVRKWYLIFGDKSRTIKTAQFKERVSMLMFSIWFLSLRTGKKSFKVLPG